MESIRNFIKEEDFEIKSSCCGCGTCADICPAKCITMETDSEGFLYPSLDSGKCISCGKCVKTCPVINVKPNVPFDQHAYIVQHKDELVRKESTSGGAFTAIAEYVLNLDGVVYGAAYVDDDFNIEHIKVESATELWRFRNSKYVQSVTWKVFPEVEKDLMGGRYVCFSGTPCQIEGLLQYLQIDYDNLITIDVVCHAVGSPLIFHKYLEMQKEKFQNDIGYIYFRGKHYGYQHGTMNFFNKDGKVIYARGVESDPYLRAFFTNMIFRPSCYGCKFKGRYRKSDFTIWDCFKTRYIDKSFDDEKGTTNILVHTSKGMKLFEKLQNIRISEKLPEEIIELRSSMFLSHKPNVDRAFFFDDAARLNGKDLFKRYYPDRLDVHLKRSFIEVLIRTGLFEKIKWTIKRMHRKNKTHG